MPQAPREEYVTFPMILFYDSKGEMAIQPVPEVSLKKDIDSELFQNLPVLGQRFNWELPSNPRFRAFWFDKREWIPDDKLIVTKADVGHFLVIVEENTNHDISYFQALSMASAQNRDWVTSRPPPRWRRVL